MNKQLIFNLRQQQQNKNVVTRDPKTVVKEWEKINKSTLPPTTREEQKQILNKYLSSLLQIKCNEIKKRKLNWRKVCSVYLQLRIKKEKWTREKEIPKKQTKMKRKKCYTRQLCGIQLQYTTAHTQNFIRWRKSNIYIA